MRIPLGNFGTAAAPQDQTPQPMRFAPGGDDPVGRAVEQLGQVTHGVAQNYEVEQERQAAIAKRDAEEKQRKADAMARAQAASQQLDYEVAVKGAQLDVQQAVAHGQVPWQDAGDALTSAVKKIPVPKYSGTDPAVGVSFDTGVKRIQADAGFAVRGTAMKAQDADFASQWGGVLTKLDTLSGMPGADGAKIKARAASFVPLAVQAGQNKAQVERDLSAFKSRVDTNTAKGSIEAAGVDLTQLAAVKDGLSNPKGPWPDLTGAQRTALITAIDSKMQTIADRDQHAQDRADAAGARAVKGINDMIFKGEIPDAQTWTVAADAARGTSSEQALVDAAKTFQQVQTVLRMAPDQQQQWLQNAQAALAKGGGSQQDYDNLKAVETAVQGNMKAMQDEPLLWNQTHGGDAIKPLDMQQLSSPDGIAALGQQFQHRAATLDAMRKQYGDGIPMKVLLPQEADALQKVLQAATPADETALLGLMKKAVGDPEVYAAVVQQLAPKAPVLAYAGMLFDRDATMTTATHWFSPDDTITSQKAAQTMLEGQRILSGKGTGKTYVLPKDTDFRNAFDDATGDLFRGRPDAAALAMQAVKAYYVGAGADAGDLSDELDDKRLAAAIKITLGEPADVNGHGNVLPPWGMPPDVFEQAAQSAFERAAKAAKLPQARVDAWGSYGLRQIDQSRYYVVAGNNFLIGADGKPLVIDVQPEDAGGGHGLASRFLAVSNPAGLLQAGNIDLNARPVVHNSDGTISTVRSITITDDQGRATLIPTVVGDRVVSNKEAFAHYRKTGENLGVFKDEKSADAYAEQLHEQQAREYAAYEDAQ